ncbi:hypothetical protein SISSUDRAFT_1040014 [Sistotremastrum suecicum HHB10207 ss-3]|uniref:Uncharacterized protein n=1 Tax=Sistotremastrum suecicum HHB10207 ss-3 TaxID=1314776 RepID=A0A166IAS1_9AGAM|nr:hypothetical protein SISSUDRAFT_1040014 [Sistotremastrum suecicum HHB10207 ss-3]
MPLCFVRPLSLVGALSRLRLPPIHYVTLLSGHILNLTANSIHVQSSYSLFDRIFEL